MTEKRILYLSHRIPYPPNKGDKIRSFNQIRFLARRARVDLLAFADDPKDLQYKEKLARFCSKVDILKLNPKAALARGVGAVLKGKSITQGYFYHPTFQQRVNQWTAEANYDAVICFSSPMAAYVMGKKSLIAPEAVFIMDFCDLDSDKWRQYSLETFFPMNRVYEREAVKLLRFEGEVAKAFTHSVFVSKNEALLFQKPYPHIFPSVLPNGVDYGYFDPEKTDLFTPVNRPMLMFSGAMDYHANVDGVTWFVRDIFPKIRKALPGAVFYIVGSNPAPAVQKLSQSRGVIVTGFVADMRPYYKAADLCVIPLRIARGVQNKVLEAMAMEKAVLVTPISIQGISPRVGHDIAVADRADGFARKSVSIINNSDLSRRMGRSARSYVKENHDWEKNLLPLNDFMGLHGKKDLM